VKRSWIESTVAYKAFLVSSWVILLLGIEFIFILTPWINLIQGPARGPFLVRTLGASIGVAAVAAGPVIFIGMAIFCGLKDCSPRIVKVLWFLLFLVTSVFGAVIYFFTVYRPHFRNAGQVSVQTGAGEP